MPPPPKISALQIADIDLPAEVEGLGDLAYNLWWTWTPAARRLFATISPASWSRYRNPVELLLGVDRHHWEALLEDDAFTSSYREVMADFERYLDPGRQTWVDRRLGGWPGGPVAYFSMEYGLHQSLAIYSGGLGVLSGDHTKSASDLGLPFVGVGLLYRRGYFQQTIDAEGVQQHFYPEYDFQRLPLRPALDARGRPVTVEVPLPGRQLAAKVWLAQVGRVPLLLLDTDIPENEPADRPITWVLYVRGRETRLLQELVLGLGGARALAAVGVEPGVWHINEGHSALLQVERLRRELSAEALPVETALERLAARTVFTTHTPVAAGNEEFDRRLAEEYLTAAVPAGVAVDRVLDLGGADHGQPDQPFNLTAFALRTCGFANGVSRLNGEVADRMWRHLVPGLPPEQPLVEAITNGVHLPTWLGLELQRQLLRRLGVDWYERLQEDEEWSWVEEIPDAELWAVHLAQKERLMRFARSRVWEQEGRHGHSPRDLREISERFQATTLTIGFARRFALYKRAGLLFSDLHRLRRLLANQDRPVQVFLAGKAHPADRPGQELIQHICRLSQDRDLAGRVVFLENYDIRVGRMLVQGVDVWLNTPRRQLEASGTSGQKAAINGVLNLSILDGWWPEGFDGANGWAIGGSEGPPEEARQDQEDSLALYHALEEEVIPAYYERDDEGVPRAWVAKMKRAIASIGPRFSSGRMVREYARRAYRPLAAGEGRPLVLPRSGAPVG